MINKKLLREYYLNTVYPDLKDLELERKNVLFKVVLTYIFILCLSTGFTAIFVNAEVLSDYKEVTGSDIFVIVIAFIAFSSMAIMISETLASSLKKAYNKRFSSRVLAPLINSLGDNITFDANKGHDKLFLMNLGVCSFDYYNRVYSFNEINMILASEVVHCSQVHILRQETDKLDELCFYGFCFTCDIDLPEDTLAYILNLGTKMEGLPYYKMGKLMRDRLDTFANAQAIESGILSKDLERTVNEIWETVSQDIRIIIKDTKLTVMFDTRDKNYFQAPLKESIKLYTGIEEFIEYIDAYLKIQSVIKKNEINSFELIW